MIVTEWLVAVSKSRVRPEATTRDEPDVAKGCDPDTVYVIGSAVSSVVRVHTVPPASTLSGTVLVDK